MTMRLVAFAVFTIAGFIVLSADAAEEARPQKLEVWDVRGPATYTLDDGVPQPLTSGTDIPPGAVIKTGAGAAVDLSLGRKIGSLRLTQKTVLSVEKYDMLESDDGRKIDLRLALPEGTLLGDLREFPAGSASEVKMPSGLAHLQKGKARLQPDGYIVVLEGSLLFVHVPASGDPLLHKLNGPPPVYFAPGQGVQPAPPPLIREVEGQIKASLRP